MDKTIGLYDFIDLLKPIYKIKDHIIVGDPIPSGTTVEDAFAEFGDVLLNVTGKVLKIQEG